MFQLKTRNLSASAQSLLTTAIQQASLPSSEATQRETRLIFHLNKNQGLASLSAVVAEMNLRARISGAVPLQPQEKNKIREALITLSENGLVTMGMFKDPTSWIADVVFEGLCL